jgi:hypothetical protein
MNGNPIVKGENEGHRVEDKVFSTNIYLWCNVLFNFHQKHYV